MKEATKQELREQYLQKRMDLSEFEIQQLNTAIFENFKTLALNDIQYIHFFIPIKRQREPNTLPLMHWLFKEHPEKKIVISRSNLQTHIMEHFLWDNSQVLHSNAWGIEEPLSGEKVLSQQIDAVILPLLAYDKEGNRVGFGKGFYDRFLADCRPNCKKMGISFFPPVNKIKDIQAHDKKLDLCISAEEIWSFNTPA